ncbi:MAG TPA: NAD(P)/FAD-dependent oxidoreductase [Thermoleophilaceae bacterium]|jgi:cation diffusion facilitator CzcD-associated flavoprotein CzcO|nr:NAD(P)/FAD-dependent oxidoreductase [Thermoleophilaceae bacterium]
MTGNEAVVIIGAGSSGLASAAELGRLGVRTVVLEEADQVGWSWRHRYDRLRLNSSRPFSKLPKGPYPKGTGIFPSRDEMVRYLERYSRSNAVDVRFGTRLERIDREGDGWVLRTSAGDMAAGQVIVAGGYSRRPFTPDWPGRESFRGRLLHAAEYRNPEPFRDEDVLVIGPGCSGAEIAYDIAEGGARRVRLAVRTPPNILIRAPLGPLMAQLMMKLPTRWADAIMRQVRRHEVGDLSEYGLPVPEEGVFTRLERLGVAPMIVDKEVIEAIKERRIEIVAGVEGMDETGVALADGSRIEPDSVIAATGYGRGLEPLVGHLGVLDERGSPRVTGDEAAPGLRFVGYVPYPAMIRYAAGEAKRAAKAIAASEALERTRGRRDFSVRGARIAAAEDR